MSPGLVLIGGLFVAVYAYLGFRAVRNPLLARLAAREAVRRGGQTVLVVAGLMIGSAGITAAAVGADSAEDSSVLNAYRAWGMTDLTLTAGDRLFSPSAVGAVVRDPTVGPLIDGAQAGLELVGSAADLTRRQGESAVRLIGFDPAAQRPFGAYTLTDGASTYGEDLGPGEVILSRQLAGALGARPGDRFTMSLEQPGGARATPIPLMVAGIARSEGPGAYGLRSAVFAPLATAQAIAGTDLINIVRISAVGGLETGLQGGDRAYPGLEAFADSLKFPLPLEVRRVKAVEVAQARKSTEFSRSMLVGMSVLIIAAGAALVVNLVMMLAEERRPRLAVIRALGLTRRKLVTLSVLEGAIYSLAAAAVGTAVGVFAGRIVAARFAKAFAQFFGASVDFRFVFSVRPTTIAVSFASGALITLGTLFLAARRTSRMSIPAAIRNLPEPVRERRRRWPRAVLLALAAGGGALGLLGGSAVWSGLGGAAFGRLVGGIMVVIVAGALTRRRIPDRLHSTLAGGLLAGWSFIMVSAVSKETDAKKFFTVFVVAVLGAVFGLSIVASANLRIVEWAVGLLGRLSVGLRTTLRPPLAYLSRRPLRTGLSTGVFAVILAIVSMLAVFLSIFRPQYERDSAGYEIRVLSSGSTTVALPASVSDDIAGRVDVPTRGYVGPFRSQFTRSEVAFIPLFEFSPELLANPPARLTGRAAGFGSDAAVWAAVGRDPRWVVSDFGQAGETIELQGPAGPVRLRIAGTQRAGILDGLIGSPEALTPFSSAPLGVTVLLHTTAGASPEAVARTIERALFRQGVDATTTHELLDNSYRANKTFFSVVEVLMRMGLVVGILSLGILGLRAVVERRHVIGVLRAIGYKRRGVMGGLMAEAGVTASIGVFVGTAVGLGMGYIFFRDFAPDTPFGIDGASIGGALALVYIAVVLVTLGPAWRASRLPPAEAVRYTD